MVGCVVNYMHFNRLGLGLKLRVRLSVSVISAFVIRRHLAAAYAF